MRFPWTDASDNSSTATGSLTIDTQAPAAPVINSISQDTGLLGDQITADNTLLFSGTAEPNSQVELLIDGTVVGTSTTDAAGNWVFDYSATSLSDGEYQVSAQASDSLGNRSEPSALLPVTIDTSAPTAPTVNALISASLTPLLTGSTGTGTSLAAGETLTVSVSDATYSVTPDSNGDWSLDLSSAPPTTGSLTALTNGNSYEVTATVSHIAGNSSSDSSSTELSIDTSAPAVPSINSLASNSLTPTITGTNGSGAALAVGETLVVTVSGATYSVTPDSSGNWSLDLSIATPTTGSLTALTNGNSYEVTATVSDTAGNSSHSELSIDIIELVITNQSTLLGETTQDNVPAVNEPLINSEMEAISSEPSESVTTVITSINSMPSIVANTSLGSDSTVILDSNSSITGSILFSNANEGGTEPANEYLSLVGQPDDMMVTQKEAFSYSLSDQMFQHYDPAEQSQLQWSAKQLKNGSEVALPDWMSFDTEAKTFNGTPPSGAENVVIVITAKDSQDRAAKAKVNFKISDDTSGNNDSEELSDELLDSLPKAKEGEGAPENLLRVKLRLYLCLRIKQG